MGDGLLSVVVPIFQMSGKLHFLFSWLLECENFLDEIQIILVLDSGDLATVNEVENFCKGMSNFNGRLVKGNFNSPGESRNAGITYCTGRWVTFWDSDDSPNVRNVVESLRAKTLEGCDAIIGSYEVRDLLRNRTTSRICFEPGTQEFILDIAIQPGLWRFLLKRELATSELFPLSKMGEDQIYLTRIFAKIRNLSVSGNVFYTYHQNFPGQLTSDIAAKQELTKTVSLFQTSPYEREDLSLIRIVMLRKIFTTALRTGTLISRVKLAKSYYQLISNIKHNSEFKHENLSCSWNKIIKESWKRRTK